MLPVARSPYWCYDPCYVVAKIGLPCSRGLVNILLYVVVLRDVSKITGVWFDIRIRS